MQLIKKIIFQTGKTFILAQMLFATFSSRCFFFTLPQKSPPWLVFLFPPNVLWPLKLQSYPKFPGSKVH